MMENLASFFADFGTAVTVGGVACVGLFDNGYAQALGFVSGSAPSVVVKAADVPSVAQGAAVTIAAASYTVTAIEPDGAGLVLLRLQEA